MGGTVEKLCKPADKAMFDISNTLLLFDGNRGHSVQDFKGERFSLVYFCTGQWHKANKAMQIELAACGINFPTKQSMAMAKKMLGTPRGYKALAALKQSKHIIKPVAQAWPLTAAKEG